MPELPRKRNVPFSNGTDLETRVTAAHPKAGRQERVRKLLVGDDAGHLFDDAEIDGRPVRVDHQPLFVTGAAVVLRKHFVPTFAVVRQTVRRHDSSAQ